MSVKPYEKALVKLAEKQLSRGVNSTCMLYILYQSKISDEMKQKLERFRKK